MISKKLSGISEIIFFKNEFDSNKMPDTKSYTCLSVYYTKSSNRSWISIRRKSKLSDHRTIVKRKRENRRTTVKVGTRVYAFMRAKKTHLVWNFCVSSWPAHIILLPNNYCLYLITLKYQSEELLPR